LLIFESNLIYKTFHYFFKVEPDNDSAQEMGNPDQEMSDQSESDEGKLSELRQQATGAFVDGDYEKAAGLFTEAIKLNSQSAPMFAKRANCYIHLNKPNDCIRDCNRAIELNPDSAPAHKFRGCAHRFFFMNFSVWS
jgi:suppressor of tumorigenicity protein 13